MTAITGSLLTTSTVADPQISQPTNGTAVASFTPSTPSAVAQDIERSKGRNWKEVSIRTVNLCSSVALGAFTGLACAGVMVTPMGWAIASGALFMGLGLAKEISSDELKTNLGISAAGFALAVGPAYLATKSVVATVVCIAAEIMLLFMIKMAWDKKTPDLKNSQDYPTLSSNSASVSRPLYTRRRGPPRLKPIHRVRDAEASNISRSFTHSGAGQFVISANQLQVLMQGRAATKKP